MTSAKGKTTTIAAALLIILAMAISLLASPANNKYATAQTPTYAYINCVPNPVGVNQEVLLHIGITQQLNSAEQGWEDLTVTVTRPDNTTETLGPYKTDSTGGTGDVYIPTMEGTYTLQTHFPAQNGTDYWGDPVPYEASDSAVLELVVQADPIEYHPGHSLPTEYWTRPIDSQLREWGAIAGSSWEVEYNDAPESAHILWTRPHTIGGVVGGSLGEHAFECGDAYEGKWGGSFGGGAPFISAGRLYYNRVASSEDLVEYVCTDVRTGEIIWIKTFLNNLTISFAQNMYWDTYDYHGAYDYLWASGNSGTRNLLGLPSSYGNPLCAFDSVTGEFSWAFYDLPSGSRSVGPKGEILYYSVSLSGGYMTLWNSSAVISLRASTAVNSMGFGQWKAMGKIQNATSTCPVTHDTPLGINGYSWNISIPSGLEGSVREVNWGESVKGTNVDIDDGELDDWAFSLVCGEEGTLLYNHHATFTGPGEEIGASASAYYLDGDVEDHVVLLWESFSRRYWAYSFYTGAQLWKSEDFEETANGESYLNQYDRNTEIAYGNVYATGVSGIVYCYNFQEGLIWTYYVEDPYSEFLFNNNWWQEIQYVTDGKIYMGHTEHSPIDPKPRDAPFICLNATTGELIWRANGMFRQTHWGGSSVIGDSVICCQDTYDQRVYAIGKGPSATTVSIQTDIITHGKASLVTGTVMDVSPGTSDIKITMRFPNGVPAVCDENMSDWMVYVYKQFERPADAVGVEVVISVLDPNNNCYEVARTTSDASGFFSAEFEPEVPGKYTVTATFEGSRSYYGSFAETALLVEAAPEPTPIPTASPAPMTDTYVTGFGIGMIIAIVVIGLLIILMLRRR
jgi:hypothetical protein